MEIAGNDIEIYAYSDLLMGATAYGIAHAENTWTWSYANQQPTDDLNVHDNRIECVFNDVSTNLVQGIYINESNNTVISNNIIKNVTVDGLTVFDYRKTNVTIVENLIDGFGTCPGDSFGTHPGDPSERHGVHTLFESILWRGDISRNIIRYETQTARPNNAIGINVWGSGTKNLSIIDNDVSPTCWLHELVTVIPANSNVRIEAYGTAAPSYGAHTIGNIYWNTNPSAGGPAFWMTTTGGKPGIMTPCNLST